MNEPDSLTVEINAETSPVETLAVPVFTDEPRLLAPESLEGALRETCERLLAEGEFEGEADSTLSLHMSLNNDERRRLMLVGLGERAEFDAHALRRAAAMAARAARQSGARALRFPLPQDGDDSRAHARALVEGVHLGLYENDFYRKPEEDDVRLERLILSADEESAGEIRGEVERARIVAESVNWARRLTDEPGLSLTPVEFARRAAEMAAEAGLSVETLYAEEIRERGMGAFAGVAQGSDEEPALIVLRYEPEGVPPDDDELWAFVGKGITFDTGGISIKHGLDMWEMKSDMAGGAAALGALRALALLGARRRIVAVVPATENMPSGRSIKPGDIVRTFAGHTIEVVDTDAEGRLVLVDGIAYAKHLGATRIVDLATLTGSIIIALGDRRTGLFSNDDRWAALVQSAAERAGEPVWRMPVSDDYEKLIESSIADFKNYGGRPDATGAALLLSKFAGDTPWVHLDIAGTSWHDAPQPHAPEGASGTAVRTLIELALGE